MIFLSHTSADKHLVDSIAQRLVAVYGTDNVFYDSWSIQPGDGIIDKMNIGLEKCQYFLFFVSEKSLESKMVSLEWQNALYKKAREGIKFIPIKIDNCNMPSLLLQTLYIDMFSHGFDICLRQIVDVINGDNIYRPEQGFQNIQAYVSKSKNGMVIEFTAETYMEPQSRYLIRVNNLDTDLKWKCISDSLYFSDFKEVTMDNGEKSAGILLSRESPTSPGFPFIMEISAEDGKAINFIGAMQFISSTKLKSVRINYIP